MTVVNARPRPAALLESLPDDVAEAVSKLFPTTQRVTAQEAVHESEWDVLVTTSRVRRSPHLYVVAFGSAHLGMPFDPEGSCTAELDSAMVLALSAGALATELTLGESVAGTLRSLVYADLVAAYNGGQDKRALALVNSWSALFAAGSARYGPPASPTALRGPVATLVEPFLMADEAILAGRFTRSAGWTRNPPADHPGGDCWFLPGFVQQPVAWVNEALRRWHARDPVRFPAPPGWWTRDEWSTPVQISARAAIADIEADRVSLLAQVEDRLVVASSALESADRAAIDGAGRLLAEDGPELEDAVASAFETVGFVVQRMDAIHADGDKREDLRVTDPNDADWEVLVEVKGYSKGAAVNDLARLNRWSARYAAERGRMPDGLWHVVNHLRGSDPSARPTAIPNDEDLVNLTADGGLFVDTRQLFRLQRDVETATLTGQEARAALRGATGRWTY